MTARDGFVHIDNVTKVFDAKDGAVVALDEVSLRIEEGEFVSILGPSGCGKSTLLAIIAGIERASAGGVRIGGIPVAGPFTEAGVVFQRDLLLEWRTSLQNILLQFDMRGKPSRGHEAKAMELLSQVGIAEFADKRPRQLSGGMRQRVAICRALAHDPKLILMDEPFGALDAMTRDRLNVDLASLSTSESKTVIFVTHSIEEAVFLSDRVLMMTPRPGRIALDLAIDLPRPRSLELKADPAFQLYCNQLRDELDKEGAFAHA